MTFIKWKLAITTYHDSIIVQGEGAIDILDIETFLPKSWWSIFEGFVPDSSYSKINFWGIFERFVPNSSYSKINFRGEKGIFFIFKIIQNSSWPPP